MRDAFDDVKDFHRVAGQKIRSLPENPEMEYDEKRFLKATGAALDVFAKECRKYEGEGSLRARLMLEELGETIRDMAEGNLEGLADGLADLIYVAVGTAVTFGINLGDVWEEVQRANMDKFPNGKAVIDEHGKVRKPEGWTPPDIQKVLANQEPIDE